MKQFLIASLVLVVLSISGLLYIQPNQAMAVPVSYNVTQLSSSLPFSTLNLSPAPTQNFLFDSGRNGTINSIYNATIGSSTLKYLLGDHPTLPISLDTTSNLTSSASTAATQKLNVTIATGHSNTMLVVGISFRHDGDSNANNRISTVKIGSNAFTKLINKTVACAGNECSSELWYLPSSVPTGFTTITITPVTTSTYHIVAGVYSIYNARILNPVGVSASANGTSVTPSVSLTPTFTGTSWLINNIFSLQTTSPTAPSDTIKWVGKTAAIMGSSQIKTAPTINAGNTMTYTTTNVRWMSVGAEIIPIQDQTTFNWNLGAALATNGNLALGDNKANTNGSKFYYLLLDGPANMELRSFDVTTGAEVHVFYTSRIPDSGTGNAGVGFTGHTMFVYSFATITNGSITTSGGNQSILGGETLIDSNNQYMKATGFQTLVFHYNNNSTTPTNTALSQSCSVDYTPSQTLTPIDSINCDRALPAPTKKYWFGLQTTGAGNYGINSTLSLLNSVIGSTYKTQLTIPSHIYGIDSTNNPDVRLVGHWSGKDWLISYTATKIKYVQMSAITTLLNQNRAIQPFMITTASLDSLYGLTPSSVNPKSAYSIKFYGPSLNATTNYYGMFTLLSGYTTKLDTNNEHNIRTIDPQWLNLPTSNYPAIYSNVSLFPIYLTVANAPSDAGIMVTSQTQTINGLPAIWALSSIDASRTVEFDLPLNTCANIYIANISTAPFVYNFEGEICANGVNQKTIAYVNTLPTTFYTMSYAATHTYTPSTNTLSVTTRSVTTPFTYNIIVKNSTGAVTTNFTATSNSTVATNNFNITGSAKPSSLYVSIPGTGVIYSAYMGSALSLASVAAFFHTYLNYQGFDFLSFIPIIFAAMFTRNTVGIGMAMVVVCIATLSFLSVVVVSDQIIIVMILIAITGMIGYRSVYG